MQDAQVVFCTSSICGRRSMRSNKFDVGLIDEASQCVEAEMVLALKLIKNRCVLVG
jgi:superfamily I DNA and/or RNA helicase